MAIATAIWGCGPSSPDETGASTDVTEDDTEPDQGPQLVWENRLDGCGALWATTADDSRATVAGSADGRPVVAQVGVDAEVSWTYALDVAGGFFAIARPSADPVWWVGGTLEDDDAAFGTLVRIDATGSERARVDDLGEPGSGVYGIAALDGGVVVTGLTESTNVLVRPVSADSVVLPPWTAPNGNTFGPAVGFAARELDGGVVVCGRASATEGGRSWLARYDGDGAQRWEVRGDDPGVGAFMDCWDVAVAEETIAMVERGYAGGRIGVYDLDGALLWEHAAADTGTQAVDVAPDGRVVVGGWSAVAESTPFRAHSVGDKHGWVAVFDSDGHLATWTDLGPRRSIHDLRIHGDGAVTVVGADEADPVCSRPWIARLDGI